MKNIENKLRAQLRNPLHDQRPQLYNQLYVPLYDPLLTQLYYPLLTPLIDQLYIYAKEKHDEKHRK